MVSSYKTNDFKKGLKIQIDGEPYVMVEMNFVKPGKGNALYKCKMRNLLRGTMFDRTYKGGDELEAADCEEISVQYLYKQGETFVFMHSETFEQYELTSEQVDDAWKYLENVPEMFDVIIIDLPDPDNLSLSRLYSKPFTGCWPANWRAAASA